MNNLITEFYLNNGPAFTDQGVFTLPELIEQNNDFWEDEHSFIQWIFPLPEHTNFKFNAPLLDKETASLLEGKEIFRDNFKDALYRFQSFLNDTEWCTPNNHNILRIGRALRSMTLLGFHLTAEIWEQKLSRKIIETLGEKQPWTAHWHKIVYNPDWERIYCKRLLNC